VAADNFCIGDPRLDRPAGAEFFMVGALRFELAPNIAPRAAIADKG
jgi:hypothetical protein